MVRSSDPKKSQNNADFSSKDLRNNHDFLNTESAAESASESANQSAGQTPNQPSNQPAEQFAQTSESTANQQTQMPLPYAAQQIQQPNAQSFQQYQPYYGNTQYAQMPAFSPVIPQISQMTTQLPQQILQQNLQQPVLSSEQLTQNSAFTSTPLPISAAYAPQAQVAAPSTYAVSAAQAPVSAAPAAPADPTAPASAAQASTAPTASAFSAPVLLGTYTPKIDAKGRVALPAKFRSQLGQGFVIARGQERCVYVLPISEFQRITSQIQRTSMSNKSARDYLRVFLSGAVDEVPDKQGRIVVPTMLRNYANLSEDIVVIGVGTRAEIWDKSAWEDYLSDREQGYADIADDVLPAVM